MADETFRWFAGVDWGSAKHQVCLLDGAGKVVGERAFAHGGAGLAALCDWLVSAAGDPGSVAVAIEVPHGPVVDALLDRGFAVHAINPKQLERLRDRISLAGAKDDRRDARVAAGGLRTDPHLFRPVEAGDPAVIALREWSRLAEGHRQKFRVWVGHDGWKGAQPCRDAKSPIFPMPSWTSCWLGPIPRRPSIRTAFSTA
jgi:hypothetical protein